MGIYSKIVDLQKLGMAWDHVRKNKPVAGVDNVTYEDFENRRKEELRQLNLELLEHRYESLPVRNVNLYKGEKVRTIALFSMRDKVVQQSLAAELGKIYEPLFSKCSYAYRSGQSALNALDKIEKKIKKESSLWVLKMDIASYFDNINHQILIQKLRKQVHEQDVLELVRAVLEAAVLDEKTGELKKNQLGVIQGSSSAPIMSNIYLMDYDSEMERRSSFYIRYSDDILVLEENEQKAKELYEFTRVYLENLGLQIKESKTEMHELSGENGFEYLGYAFSSRGKMIPQKAKDSLCERIESVWLTSKLDVEDKLKKCQEIIGGWEQYFRGEREIVGIIEYVTLLSMIRTKSREVVSDFEKKRFSIQNYYKDVLNYLVDYWMESGRVNCAIWEYEQFFQVDSKSLTEQLNPIFYEDKKLCAELLEDYRKLIIKPDEEIYADIIQIYTDLGEYQKASYFWSRKNENGETQEKTLPVANAMCESVDYSDGGIVNSQMQSEISISEYMNLFVGREDTYVRELLLDGNRRKSEQFFEPVTGEKLQKHLEAREILGTYVQRPNNTAKYLVFDIDISKKILLKYPYGTAEFTQYKQIAADRMQQLMKLLKKMGIAAYAEDSGFRGYHVWVFFTEWIPVRYINQLSEVVRRELDKIPISSGEEGDIGIECFPNNVRIRQGKCGPCIKLPLGIHIRTGERSFFMDAQLQPIKDYMDFFQGIAKISLNAVRKIIGMHMEVVEENMASKPEMQMPNNLDLDIKSLGIVPEQVKIVLEHCSLMRYLCRKAQATGYLSHFERQSILYVFGHMGEPGKEFVHTIMGLTMNYQYNVTQKFITKLPDKPISCLKLRDQYKMVTAEIGCSCSFKQTKNCYPSPVLHAIKNSGENELEITIPTSRSVSKAKEEIVYDEINIHRQTQKLAERIVELKKQKNGLDKSIRKIEQEMQRIFDNAGIDCLEIDMGMLVRRRKGDGYEWLIEI